MEDMPIVFLIMISVAVFLLVWNLMVPVFGAERKAAKRLKRRLRRMATQGNRISAARMLREKYIHKLNPFERKLETLPGMDQIALLIEQSGRNTPAPPSVAIQHCCWLGRWFPRLVLNSYSTHCLRSRIIIHLFSFS